MSFELRPLTDELVPAFRQAISAGFGFDTDLEDEEGADRFNALFALDRMFPAFDGDELISTGGDFGFQMTVPGGAQVPMAGLTIVTVRPTHTRQGVLTAMVREHFARAKNRGEILGGLWASESTIYARFGYGPAVQHHTIKLDTRVAGRGGSEPGVNIRLVEGEVAETLIPKAYAAAQTQHPGMFQRTREWWKHRLFYDPERWRDGASAVRHAVAEQGGEVVGYVSYRQKASWDQLSEGEIRVKELIPVTDAGYRALWHYVTSIDLFPIVKHWNVPPDDPLPLLLSNGRAVATTGASDGLWIRLVDVPAALEARTYSRDGSVVVKLTDGFCAWNTGTYRLSVADGSMTCDRVGSVPEVTMDVSALGALYMGGRDANALARVGLIDGDAGVVQNLNWMFRRSPEPWCAEVF